MGWPSGSDKLMRGQSIGSMTVGQSPAMSDDRGTGDVESRMLSKELTSGAEAGAAWRVLCIGFICCWRGLDCCDCCCCVLVKGPGMMSSPIALSMKEKEL